MADVLVTCKQCGRQTSVSEYVDADKVVCGGCGTRLTLPREERPPPSERFALLTRTFTPPPEPNPEYVADRRALREQRERQRDRSRSRIVKDWPGWLLFFVLGTVMGVARYGGVVPEARMETFRLAGHIVLGALHVVVALDAFKDDIFQGLLCLGIPGYQLYYLFARSDSFYLRAVVAAALIGFGADTVLFLQEHFVRIHTRVHERLMRGA